MQVFFRGNHVDSKISGTHVLECKPINGEIERYEIEWPLIVAKGLVWGDAHVELGEKLIIKCVSNQMLSECSLRVAA